MATVEFRFDVKPVSYVTDNQTLVLSDGEPIFLENGMYAFGDGTTQLSALTFFGDTETGASRVITTGTLVSVTGDDITVAAATYYISGEGTFSSPETAFNNIALSASGTQRFVAFFGNTSSTVTKVEGSESSVAEMPATPADTVLLGYVLVTDGEVSSTPDLSGYLLRADKATAADIIAGTNDEIYITPYALASSGTTRDIIHLEADFSTTSGTVVDITDLVIPLEAGKQYLIEGYIVLALPTNGSRLTAVWPNGLGRLSMRTNLVDALQRSFTDVPMAGAGSQESAVMNALAVGGFCVINCGFNCLTAGNFQMQVRSVTGGNTTTVRNHTSYLKVTEIV